MKHEKNDRRTLRSQRLLGEALVALMREQPYEAITVGEIIERANIGRSTFYSHFYDKDDLLVSNLEAVLSSLGRQIGGVDGDSILPSLALFRHIQAHRDLYKALARGKSIELLLKTAQAFLVRTIAQNLRDQIVSGPLVAGLLRAVWEAALANELAGSFLALLRWWLDNDLPYGAEQIDAIFRRLAMPGPIDLLAELA